MPLETQVLRRNVKFLPEHERGWESVDHIWDYFTLSCMYTAAIKETAPDTPINGEVENFGELPEGAWVDFSLTPIYYLNIPECPLVSRGKQTLSRRHEFRYNDERTVVFEAGDILKAWRSSK